MKKPSPPTSSEHPDALLLPYVEDMITPREKAEVEEHLSTCDQCASRAEELRETTAALKQNKQAFCPEPWELHDFAQSGNDPHGVISLHVEHCPLCSEDLGAWKMAQSEEPMPAELWNRLRERLPREAPKQVSPERPRWVQTIWESLARFWKAPAMAASAVAAVLLVAVVIFYPLRMAELRIAHSVNWEGVPKAKSLQKKAAFIILENDYKNPIFQKVIDSLYEGLAPTMELNELYGMVSPAEISEAIKSGTISARNKAALIKGLRDKLNVSSVIIITIFRSDAEHSVHIELVDTASGRTLNTRTTKTDKKMSWHEVEARIRSDAFSMLLSSSNQR